MLKFKSKQIINVAAISLVLIASNHFNTTADAVGKYTLNNGKLITTKTGNIVKGTVLYKEKLYKNGVKATAVYKGAYYSKGIKKVSTGLYKNKYYINGRLGKGILKYKSLYYKDGVLATGTYVYKGSEEAFEKGLKVKVKMLQIKAINSKEIKLTFNKSIDERTITATNFEINSGNEPHSAVHAYKTKLSANKQAVVLKFSEDLLGKYSINMKGQLKTLNGEKLKKLNTEIVVSDMVAPIFEKYKKVDADTYFFYFSENLLDIGSIVVIQQNGIVLSDKDATVAKVDKNIRIVFSKKIKRNQQITVLFSGQEDFSHNISNKMETVKIPLD